TLKRGGRAEVRQSNGLPFLPPSPLPPPSFHAPRPPPSPPTTPPAPRRPPPRRPAPRPARPSPPPPRSLAPPPPPPPPLPAPAARRARARRIARELDRLYPDARCSLDFKTPLQLLIATILSAQCTDARVNLVTPALFERFPNAASLAEADQAEVEALIQP